MVTAAVENSNGFLTVPVQYLDGKGTLKPFSLLDMFINTPTKKMKDDDFDKEDKKEKQIEEASNKAAKATLQANEVNKKLQI